MELYIYHGTQLVEVVENTTSVRWRRKYFEPGEVEIHLPATKDNLELVTAGSIIRRPGRVESAIIEDYDVNGNDLAVTGRMLSSILDRAVVAQLYNFDTTYEAAMLGLIPEATRCIPLLIAGEAQGFTDPVSCQISWKNLLTAETKLSRASNIGYRVTWGDDAWIFECYKGVDRSAAQSSVPIVFFSDEFGNLAAPHYTRGISNWKNFAYVAGEGEGAARTVITIDQRQAGDDRRELFVDAKDITSENLSTAAYKAALNERGLEKLAECKQTESFEGTGENIANFSYLTDWDLGDIVTVEYTRLDISIDERVTEVEEVYENGVETITPTLGTPLPEKLNLEDNYK